LGDFEGFDPFLVEERRTRECEDVVAFSMIIYRNNGGRYLPYYEIQHESRIDYPESPNLTESGMRIWDLNPECKRMQDFHLNLESSLRDMTDQKCYEYIQSEFDAILSTINDVYDQFKPPAQ
jgi:hypothetical protein